MSSKPKSDGRWMRTLWVACALLPREIRGDQFEEWSDEIRCAREAGFPVGRRALSIVFRSTPQLAWRARRPARDRIGTAELGQRLPRFVHGSWALSAGRVAWAKAIAIALIVAMLDLGSKMWVANSMWLFERQDLLPHVTVWHVRNPGISLSLLGGVYVPVYLFTLVGALALLAFLMFRPHPRMWLVMGLVMGGVIGNVGERLYHDYVTDFLQIGGLRPVFNLADVSLALALLVNLPIHSRRSEAGNDRERQRFVAGSSAAR